MSNVLVTTVHNLAAAATPQTPGGPRGALYEEDDGTHQTHMESRSSRNAQARVLRSVERVWYQLESFTARGGVQAAVPRRNEQVLGG